MNAGLIDEFTIALSPVLFGSGIRLFEGVDAGRVALEPVHRGADATGDPPDLRSPGAEAVPNSALPRRHQRAVILDALSVMKEHSACSTT